MLLLPVAESIIVLFILIAAGWLSYRSGVLNAAATRGLSSFLVNVTLPCLILTSMQIPLSEEIVTNAGVLLAVAGLTYLISFALAFAVPRFLTRSVSERGVIGFMLVFSNLGFMGYPVAEAIFGPESLFYVSIINLPFGLLVFSAGVLMLRPDMGRRLDPKLVLCPGIIAGILGLALFLTGTRIPAPFSEAVSLLGSVTSPLAMIVVGALLATLAPGRIFSDIRLWVTAFFRLIGIPLALFLLLRPFITDPLLLGVPVLLAAMPAAANTVLLAEEYEVDAQLASEGVFFTTLLSAVTIPLVAVLIL